MLSSLERDIRDHLAAYLEGRLSAGELDAWIMPVTLTVDQLNDPVLLDLTYEIVLRLVEYGKGHRTEEDIKDILRPLATAPITLAGASSP